MQQDVLWGTADGLLRSWRVQPGAKVKQGDVLATVEPSSFQLLAPVSGTLVSHLVRNNTKVTASQHVCTISTCTHSILTISDTCATCHVQLHETSEYAFYVTPSNHPIKRKVADVEAESEAKKQALLQSKRLVLILDLDQTVLHAAILQSYDRDLSSIEMDPPQSDVFAFELSDRSRMVVKFRPRLREFLLEVHKKYEIHVYTMANAEYASKIVELINSKILADVDPLLRQQVIGQRIITRSHTEDRYEQQLRRQGGMAYVMKLREKRKDIKHIVGDSSIAVILDDSDGVWPDYLDHLIHVHPYVYWPNQADLNKVFHGRSREVAAPKPDTYSPTASFTSTSISPTPFKPSSSDTTDKATSSSDTIEPSRLETVSPSSQRKRPLSEMSPGSSAADEAMETGNGHSKILDEDVDSNPHLLSNGGSPSSKRSKSNEMEGCEEMHQLSSTETKVAEEESATSNDANPNSMDTDSVMPKAVDPTMPLTAPAQLSVASIVAATSTLLLPFGIRFLPSANDDFVLNSMHQVLCNLHTQFFDLPENSNRRKVQAILPRLRRTVLAGRRVCLTGFIPRIPRPDSTGSMSVGEDSPFALEQAKNVSKEKGRLEVYGAEYVDDVSLGNPERVTHVVSARGTTVKARTASQCESVYCVTRPWLENTFIHWSVQPETNYAMPDVPLCKGATPTFPSVVPLWSSEDEENDMEPSTAAPVQNHLAQSHEIAAPTSPSSDGFVDLDSLLQNDYSVTSDEYASD